MTMTRIRLLPPLALLLAFTSPASSASRCDGLPNNGDLQVRLGNAANGTGIPASLGGGSCIAGAVTGGCVGGLFGGLRMWGAVVNRDGELCAFITSTSDPAQTWPGSQAIAKAKAYTANAFSNDLLPLSTARLYTLTQPGHSLFGLNDSNLFNPMFLAAPSGAGGGTGQVAGGIITFGGGVPLYNSAGKIVGGLGVSGDTACADHEIAKRVRHLSGLNPPGGPLADDIIYGANLLGHSLCLNTVQNGTSVGSETP